MPRLISLFDEYNTGMPDNGELTGRPKEPGSVDRAAAAESLHSGRQVTVSPAASENFKQNIIKLLRNHGGISSEGHEGEEFLLISESSKVAAAEKLVEQ